MEFFLVSLLAIFAAAALIFWADSNNSKRVRELRKSAFAGIADFTSQVVFDGWPYGPSIAIDPNRNKVAIVNEIDPPKVLSFSDVIEVQVFRDGMTVTTTGKGGMVAGAAVGGLLLGPAGLLLGGLTTKKHNNKLVKRLSLRIYTRDIAKPMHEIVFFSDSSGAETDSYGITVANNLLEQWYGRIQAIIKGEH